MASNDINIPIEIVIDILVRLPVKSIFRFKCVCKTWHVLIQSHEFDKLHFINRSLKNKSYNCSLILPVKRKIMVNGVQPAVVSCLYRAYLDPNQTRLDLSEVALPPSFRPSLENISSNDHDLYHTIYGDAVNNKHLVYGNFEVVGSCNGLVLNLLIVSRIGHFAICNPAIENEHAFKILPCINFRDYFPSFYEHSQGFRVLYRREGHGYFDSYLHCIQYGVFGFGYDSVSSLYMIVCFTPHTALVFSLAKDGRGSWRSIDVPPDVLKHDLYRGPEPEYERVLMQAYGHGVSTNNHLHWRITEFHPEVFEYSWEGILSFDIGNEKWGRVPVLDELAIKSYIIEIGVLDGCLCLLNSRRSNYFSLDLWIMKEYGVKESWTKLFKVPNGSGIPLFHQKGRYKFLLPGTEEGLGWFNPTDNKIRKIEFHGCEFSEENYYSDRAKLCFESFVDPFSSIK